MPGKYVADILDFISNNDDFLLTTHVNADGDAIASVLACSMFLDKLHKKYIILLHDQEIDGKYRYLKNWEKIQSFNKKQTKDYQKQIKAVLIFDAPGKSRIGDVASLFSDDKISVKIDHHPSEETFGSIDWVDVSASSASAMIYEIIAQSNIDVNSYIGEAIYTGIIYDTGRLSFSNTRTRDFEICAQLVQCGVKPAQITNNLFFNNAPKALQIIGNGLQSLKQYHKGTISVIYLDKKNMEQVSQNEVEELANYSVSVSGSEVGAFIREIEPEVFKISLRSKNDVDVSKVARKFNGGGHVKASGCRFEGTYNHLIKKIVEEIAKQL